MELQRAWDAAGLSERVSEVNLIDIRDIRAQLAGDDSHIEIRLGSQDQGKRLKDGLEVLDGQKQSARSSLISYIDMSQGNKRKIVGLASGARASEATQVSNAVGDSPGRPAADRDPVVAATRAGAGDAVVRNAETKTNEERTSRSRVAEKKSDKTKKPDRHR